MTCNLRCAWMTSDKSPSRFPKERGALSVSCQVSQATWKKKIEENHVGIVRIIILFDNAYVFLRLKYIWPRIPNDLGVYMILPETDIQGKRSQTTSRIKIGTQEEEFATFLEKSDLNLLLTLSPHPICPRSRSLGEGWPCRSPPAPAPQSPALIHVC